jgi:Right handed beta helix region
MTALDAIYLSTFLSLAGGSALASECISIGAAPFLAEKPGCYNLARDIKSLDSANNAITIKGDDVVFDMKGFKISGSMDPKSASAGVYASNVKNFTIRGGTIEGFLYGIRIDGGDGGTASAGVEISKMVVRSNFFRGISVEATNAVISRNSVESTGGTVLFPEAFAVGIEIKGSDCLIQKNVIDGISSVGIGEGIGVSLSQNRQDCVILQNTISSRRESGASYGVWLSSEKVETFVFGNKINGFTFPFSVPLEGDHIWATIERNEIAGTGCSPENFKSYFGPLAKSNSFKNARLSCPALISSISVIAKSRPEDPRVVYRLAMAMFQCAAEPALENSDCCRSRIESLQVFQKASKMGVAEATRILPAIRSSIEGDKGCKL